MLFEDALKEAEDKGSRETTRKIILRMSEKGLDIDLIAQAVDLPPEKVRKIIEDKKSV